MFLMRTVTAVQMHMVYIERKEEKHKALLEICWKWNQSFW